MSTTSTLTFPTPPPTSVWGTVTFSPSPDYGPSFGSFGEALWISAECVTGCSAASIVWTDTNPCFSVYSVGEMSMISEIGTVTDTAAVFSILESSQERKKTYLECICADKTLEPWLTGPTGVCDETCKDEGEDLEDLERIHTAFSNLCGLVGVEATTTASGVEATGTGTAGSGSESSETGNATTVTGSGATGKIGITVAGSLVAAVLGLCVML